MRLLLHHIDGQSPLDGAVDDLVRDRAGHLLRLYERIQTCRVTLADKPRGSFEVHIALTVPMRTELAVSRRHGESLAAAVHAAFEAMERQLEVHVRALRRHGRPGSRTSAAGEAS